MATISSNILTNLNLVKHTNAPEQRGYGGRTRAHNGECDGLLQRGIGDVPTGSGDGPHDP